ncbi:MAG: GDP-mannose 4,6-dehydratase [Deltaproteobacteria bacterium]|nr:GDP-mannose 4,6-dehydratase [Deltaproteobacteria bacterium]MBI2501041.1 GDP-mannose 4,6-dehydratase [Deltaproteobacteria bacterium]
MRVLITGGAGFIGSHLAEKYLSKGVEVYALDNFSTGRRENLTPLLSNELFHLVEGSILDHSLMVELVGTCDVVFHMAAAVGVRYVLEHPLLSIETNIKGTDIVLELCNKFRKKVVIASSSEVYGKHTTAPLRETENIIYGPPTTWRWSYAASKLIDEYNAIAYYRMKKLPVIIVRLFNTVGPRQCKEYGMVLPRFVDQALTGKPITVYGDGSQTRTFTYVQDVVKALVKLIETSRAIGQVVNVGGNEEVSILNLAKRVKEKTKSQSSIELVPYEVAYEKDFEDMARRVPSVEKLQSLIEYVPDTPLDSILEHTIADYKVRNSSKLKADAV